MFPSQEHEAAPAPASKSKKTENISETEQEAMNIAIDESQKAPMPVYDYPPIDLLTQGKHASVAGAEAELRESSACLLDTLDSFNIEAQIIGIVRGPVRHPVRADHPARHQDLAHHCPVGRHCAVARRGERAYRAYPG